MIFNVLNLQFLCIFQIKTYYFKQINLLPMTTPKLLNCFFFFLSSLTITIAQSNTIAMTVVTEKVTKEIKEITTAENLSGTEQINTEKYNEFQAEVWPNPSNLGKVRLSVKNLPGDPLFIQIFNHKEELIQEGVIQGALGADLDHILKLPDLPGNYSIKLSNTDKLLKDLALEIL